jgi:protein-tyrosine phosphatase
MTILRPSPGKDTTVSDSENLPRAIVLQGVSNLRDLGGWQTAGGARVRFGAVLRSASLGRLTDPDAALLAATGLRTVVDLRSEGERRRWPSRLDALPGVAVHFLPIDPSLGTSLRDIALTAAASRADVLDLMRSAYVTYAFDWAHQYAAMFDLLLQPERRPLLFHCTAGKDRTGFGAALVLAALGVEWEAIRADYFATNRLWIVDPEITASLPPLVAEVLLRVHHGLLDAAFAAIAAEHGSLDTYLEQRLGLDAARRESLRDALLES